MKKRFGPTVIQGSIMGIAHNKLWAHVPRSAREEIILPYVTVQNMSECIKLRGSGAPGQSLISNQILKRLLPASLQQYVNAVNLLFEKQRFQEGLLKVTQVLVLKEGPTRDPTNEKDYRPLGLQDDPIKAATKYALQFFTKWSAKYQVVNEWQFANRKGVKPWYAIRLIRNLYTQQYREKGTFAAALLDAEDAYTSASHNRLKEAFKLAKVPQDFVRYIMNQIRGYDLTMLTGRGKTKEIRIGSGFTQGDVFAPIGFCLYVDPLTQAMCRLNIGIRIKGHLISIVVLGG